MKTFRQMLKEFAIGPGGPPRNGKGSAGHGYTLEYSHSVFENDLNHSPKTIGNIIYRDSPSRTDDVGDPVQGHTHVYKIKRNGTHVGLAHHDISDPMHGGHFITIELRGAPGGKPIFTHQDRPSFASFSRYTKEISDGYAKKQGYYDAEDHHTQTGEQSAAHAIIKGSGELMKAEFDRIMKRQHGG